MPDFAITQLGDSAAAAPLSTHDDVAVAIDAEERPRRDGRWLLVNMVVSADGATAVDGVSGELGDPADRAVFLALRGIADVVLVGSGTVTAERYRRARLDEPVRQRRRGRGQAPTPRIAVVSNAGDIDLDLPLFAAGPDATRPLVLVARDAISPDRRAALDEVADVIETGSDRVDLPAAVEILTERVGQVITCEGGPVLNGLLAAHDLIDEWCITVAPMLVAGSSERAASGAALTEPHHLELARGWRNGDELLLRYLRRR